MTPHVKNAVIQLLKLQTQSRLLRSTPFQLDPILFRLCIDLVNSQDVPTRLDIYKILNADPEGETRTPHANNRHRPSRKVTPPSSDSAEEASKGRTDTGCEDRQTVGVRV